MKFNYLFLLCLVLPHATQPMLSTTSRALKPKFLARTLLTNLQRDLYLTRLDKLNEKKKEEGNIEKLTKEAHNWRSMVNERAAISSIGFSLQLNQSTQNLLAIEKEIFEVESKLAE